MFLPLGEGKETRTLLGPLERANHNHWCHPNRPNRVGVSVRFREDASRPSFRKAVFSCKI
jgi:hypothetical protein